MAANSKKATVFITGKLHWAKVLGDPRPNYGGDAREWAFELEPNEAGIAILKEHGLADRIKGKGYNIGTKGQHADRVPFIQLKKSEFSKDGQPNTPIRVYDDNDQQWDESKLIGNESGADVKLDIRDYGAGKKKGVYPVAIRVTDLVGYQSSEFGAMDADKPEKPAKSKTPANSRQTAQQKDTFKEDFGLAADVEDELNDDLPID